MHPVEALNKCRCLLKSVGYNTDAMSDLQIGCLAQTFVESICKYGGVDRALEVLESAASEINEKWTGVRAPKGGNKQCAGYTD